jgi:hypothetical protein
MSTFTYEEIPFDPIGKHEAIRLLLLTDTSTYLHSQTIHQALTSASTLCYLDLLITGVGHPHRASHNVQVNSRQ